MAKAKGKKGKVALRLLVTNDDGIASPGLFALARELKKIGEVTVVAPAVERSASGHAITLADPLRVEEFRRKGVLFGYAVNGTPADCVKIAVQALLLKKPHMVVSGINKGPNTGTNVIYSGTVSAATEAAILGCPSMAVSLGTFGKADFSYAARFARRLVLHIHREGLPKGVLLNVNVPHLPPAKIRGVRITRQGSTIFKDHYEKRTDPRGRTYYWLAGELDETVEEEGFDGEALHKGEISITPLHFDMTNHDLLEELRSWKIKK